MTPIETQALSEALFWYGLLMIVVIVGGWFICRIYDCATETPEEQAQREAQEIARKATQEFEKRKRMKCVRFWNVFN